MSPLWIRPGSRREVAVPLELARAILLIAIAILAITIVLPALLELSSRPFS